VGEPLRLHEMHGRVGEAGSERMLRGDRVQARLMSSVRAESARSVLYVKSRRALGGRAAAAWRPAAGLDQGVET
jgi:hypothetical protein